MSHSERINWDQRYAAGEYQPRQTPSPFLEQWLPAIVNSSAGAPKSALDVATGAGRHALRLAEAGFQVDAVDISAVALSQAERTARQRGLNVNWQCADLDEFQPTAGYDLITVFRYRNQALWPKLAQALADGGWVVVEHHLRTTATVDGPPSDEFRVAPGELLEGFGGLRIIHLHGADRSRRQPGHGSRRRAPGSLSRRPWLVTHAATQRPCCRRSRRAPSSDDSAAGAGSLIARETPYPILPAVTLSADQACE